jgi:Phytanoyl-CoA dioxygenase (PhyH)
MRLFRRNKSKERDGGVAVVDRPAVERPTEIADDFQGSTEELFAEIERLTEANRANRDRDTERRLLRLRHYAGIRVLTENGSNPEHPSPDFAHLPEADTLPEIPRADVTPELLRAGILRDGCLLVRGLVDREEALRFADQIDRSFAERERLDAGESPAEGYYEEFDAQAPFEIAEGARIWVKEGGGVLAPDAPMLAYEMLEMFESAGLPRLVGDYLGERPMISLQKTTLRKAEPHVGGAWHQDGAFMGEVRALNLWLSLSRCGDESPGLDIVPRRLDELAATTTDEAVLSYQVSRAKAEEAAGDKQIIRPIFEPGDALFFDEMFLHATGSDPSMPKPRFAIESWFFGGSAFPAEYGPIAV